MSDLHEGRCCNSADFLQMTLKTIYHEEVKHGTIKTGIKPCFQTEGAACADVAIPYDVIIGAGEAVKVDLLLSFNIPAGYKIVMYPRSSLLIKQKLLSPVSIIDSDYHGHVHVPLLNISDDTIYLNEGLRVAQIECIPAMAHVCWEFANKQRGQEGFGTTGEA